jgi:hypothetical protein
VDREPDDNTNFRERLLYLWDRSVLQHLSPEPSLSVRLNSAVEYPAWYL